MTLSDDTPLGVVRNYQGLKEINYLLTLRDFKEKFASEPRRDFFSTHDPDRDWSLFTQALENEGSAEWAIWNNDTMTVTVLDDKKLPRFLSGGYNDDISEYVGNNFDSGKYFDDSLQGCVTTALEWFWALDADDSSPELVGKAKETHLEQFEEATRSHYCSKQAILDELRDAVTEDEYERLAKFLAEA